MHLKKTDEISSTEKLLHVIRNRDDGSGIQGARENREDFIDQEFKPSLSSLVPFKKKITLSIIVGSRDVILVLLSRVSDQDATLLDHQKVPFSPDIRKDGKQFSFFLRSTVVQFLGSRKPDHVWSIIPSVKIETRFLAIPKVPQNQIPRVAYFSFNKINPINNGNVVFDFEILGEVMQGNVPKLHLFAYTADANEVQKTRKLFSGIGLPLTGISIVPFATQNIFRNRLLGSLPANICTLYVGKDWSRIDIFSSGNLVLSRDIKTGINSIVEAVRGHVGQDRNADAVASDNRQEEKDRKLLEIVFDHLENTGSQNVSAESSEMAENGAGMRDIILPVIRRLVRQVERTLEHFSVNFNHEQVEKIFITGDLCAHPQIVDLISQQLHFPIEYMDLFSAGVINVSGNRIPQGLAERDSYAPALGLAVSNNNRTPNLLYTYLQKGIRSRIQKINLYVFSTFLALIMVCTGLFYWQDHALRGKQQQIDQLQARLEQFSPQVEKRLILQMKSVLDEKRKTVLTRAESSFGLAMLAELSQQTPENIRITKMDARLMPNPQELGAGKVLIIEGVVFPTGASMDADLAVYLIKLGQSPLFKQVGIREKAIRTINGERALHFTAKLETS